MLRKIRDSSKSLAFYVLGGTVVAVLIISFGTPSVGGLAGSESGNIPAVQVGNARVSAEEFRQTLLLAGAENLPVEQAKQFRFRERVMDDVIERELLASEARRLGVVVSEAEVEEFIAQSQLMLFGQAQTLTAFQKDGAFDFDRFRRFLQFYGMNTRSFIDLQRRELVAARVREILAGSVDVSMDQVKDQYVRQGTQINLEYLRFPVRPYEEAVDPTAEEIAAFVTANEDKLKAEYEQKKFLFDKVPKERKLRQIVVQWPTADDKGKAGARKAAEKLALEINRGKAFRDVAARERLSASTRTPKVDVARLGWRREGATGLGEDLEKKVFAAEDNVLVGPEEGSEGYHLVWVEGSREGELSFDDVKMDLAEDLARKDLAVAQARRDAEAAVSRVRAALAKSADQGLKDVFPAPAQKPESPRLSGPGVPPDVQETGLFARRGAVVEGIGVSPDLANQAFSLTPDAPLAGPFDVAGSFVVVKLKERLEADMEDFAKNQYDLRRGAVEAKGREVAQEWARHQCRKARDENRIAVNMQSLLYQDGSPGTVPYEPCTVRSMFEF